MLLQQRDNFPPAFLTTLLSALFTTSSFCLSVFSRSPTFNRFSGGEEHCNTSVQQRGGGEQQRGSDYYNAGMMGGQIG